MPQGAPRELESDFEKILEGLGKGERLPRVRGDTGQELFLGIREETQQVSQKGH